MTPAEQKRFEKESSAVKKKYTPATEGGGGGRSKYEGGNELMTRLVQMLGKKNEDTGYGPKRAVCYNCQDVGHYAKNCPNPKKKRKKLVIESDSD